MQFSMDHIVIYASDQAASAAFYDTVLGRLGFEKRRDHVYTRNGLFFDIRNAHQEGPGYERGKPGVDHIGFRAESEEVVKEFQAACKATGLDSGRLINFDNGDFALFLTDPDGLRVEITCYANPGADPVD